MRVLFFGTPEFSKSVLAYLVEAGVDICGVISKPDKPKGRSHTPVPTPVKAFAQAHIPHVPLWQPEKVSDPAFLPVLEAIKPDLFVVVAYGEIIKESLLTLPKLGAINLHTSLLPRWRGAAPIQRAIMAGDAESGVTIIHLVKKMDAGNILAQQVTPIDPEMTYGELEEALLNIGMPLLKSVIDQFEKGTVEEYAQDPDLVTLAPKVELEDVEIDWNRPAQELHNLIRGANPEPGAWCRVRLKDEVKRLKIFKSRLSPLEAETKSLIPSEKNRVIVGCNPNSLELLEVQLEGKKRMSASDFLRGLNGVYPQML
jgi:methionyl-tRNA formyltransferase